MAQYRRQPCLDVMYDQRWTVRRAAHAIGVPFFHLSNATKGFCRPNSIVRKKLPILLGVDLEKLFTTDRIEHEFGMRRNRNGSITRHVEDVNA